MTLVFGRSYDTVCFSHTAGSLFLFDRKVLRYFRRDGHRWRKKKDGKTVREAHEKLKVSSLYQFFSVKWITSLSPGGQGAIKCFLCVPLHMSQLTGNSIPPLIFFTEI